MNIFEDSTKSMLLRGFRVRSPEIIKKKKTDTKIMFWIYLYVNIPKEEIEHIALLRVSEQ